MTFRFRQFAIEDDKSTMPVGTDALLLGSWINPGEAKHILDIGTGCGVIALMAAQRSAGRIDAIDTDPDSVAQARLNFLQSPWGFRLKACECSFTNHSLSFQGTYDLVLSNPPYFRNSLRSPDEKRNRARHQDTFTISGLVEAAGLLLAGNGTFAVIVPWKDLVPLVETASSSHLFPARILRIKPKAGKPFNRAIISFAKCNAGPPESADLVIRNEDNSYTDDYINLTIDFHLPLK